MDTQDRRIVTPEVFWCAGAGTSRVWDYRKPEREQSTPTRACPKFKRHGPHTWTPRAEGA